MNICAVVMAAGEGRLMKSKHAKVSHMNCRQTNDQLGKRRTLSGRC